MNTTKGSKAYGMLSYAKYIFPPLPVMIEKLIFDRAYTGLHEAYCIFSVAYRCILYVSVCTVCPIQSVHSVYL